MIVPKTIQDLQRLIHDGVEEGQQLEYKSAGALQNTDSSKKEIAKDVSAMANGNGGLIIYGMKEFGLGEKKHLPEKIDPIDRKSFSKETLESIIHANISPTISGIEIIPIPIDDLKAVYVVNVPKGSTAHQNTRDCVYYRRHNFQVLKMLNHEVIDVMSRHQTPRINLEFKIEKFGNSDTSGICNMKVVPRNNGVVYAQYVKLFIYMPLDILISPQIYQMENGRAVIEGDNLIRDITKPGINFTDLYIYNAKEYGPGRYVPILPNLVGPSCDIEVVDDIAFKDKLIEWKTFADNAPENSGSLRFGEIYRDNEV